MEHNYIPYKENKSFTILNKGNNIVNQFYQMLTPFMITCEFCSGTKEDDYINFVTLSEDDLSISQDAYNSHDEVFHIQPPHFHDYFELMIVLEGTVTQKIEDREYRYDAGMCCLITRSLCHLETFNSAAKIVFIGLSVELVNSLFEEATHTTIIEERKILSGPLYEFIQRDIKSPGQKSYLDFIPTTSNSFGINQLYKLSETIIESLMRPRFGTHHLAIGAICSILSLLSDSEEYHCTLTNLDKSSDFLIFARVEHLLQEKNGRLSRSELSSQLNYSGDYLNRIVNKYTGMCLSDYGMKFCIQRACKLLKTTDASISDIATELGFSNRTFFYKVFFEHLNMTPKEYRNTAINQK